MRRRCCARCVAGRQPLPGPFRARPRGRHAAADDDLDRVLDSAAGLTRYEAEGAFSLSIVRHGRLDPACIWDVKRQQLKKSGLVSIHRGIEANQPKADDTNWTGAEIKSCCRLASLLDVPLVQAAQNVVPVAVTAGHKIAGLRQWASGRCLSADRLGAHSRLEVGGGGRVRKVVREPVVN